MMIGMPVQARQAISPTLSVYLDLVRFMSAVFVVIYHSWEIFYPGSKVKWPGHEAVVVFFVLSGYVIAHAAMRPGMTWTAYTQHRMARILPVAWLGLALGLGLGMYLSAPAEWSGLIVPTLANLLFVGHSGWAFIGAPFNAPYWSLNYEVWYYVIFGCWLFSPRKWRNVLTGLAVLAAGPKIILLLPVWLCGVWLYKKMPAMSARIAATVFVITVIAGAVGTSMNLSELLRSGLYKAFPPAWHFHASTQFLYDWIMGVVVAMNFAAAAALAPSITVPLRLAHLIRVLAGYTFSLYVFHTLVMTFFTDVLHITHPALFYGGMALIVFLLGQLTEQRTAFFRAVLARRALHTAKT